MSDHLALQTSFVDVCGVRLEAHLIGKLRAGLPTLVFLHEGLGCIALWRDFPARIAQATGLPALVYSRRGYGRSQAFSDALKPSFMHQEAQQTLPALLEHFGIDQPVLIGHSDGASIALIHAGLFPDRPRALVAIAPHLFVEKCTTDSITDLVRRFETGDLPQRMGKYHSNARITVGHWTQAWLSPAFANWTIEPEVQRITCPVLALQGLNDEYGTMRQVERLSELAVRGRYLGLPDCGHSPFINQPERVSVAIVEFLQDALQSAQARRTD